MCLSLSLSLHSSYCGSGEGEKRRSYINEGMLTCLLEFLSAVFTKRYIRKFFATGNFFSHFICVHRSAKLILNKTVCFVSIYIWTYSETATVHQER